jgi:WD40 repeat protein/predicted Ser/Thr protein kinase
MAGKRICAQCAAEIPADAPQGFCLQCLARVAAGFAKPAAQPPPNPEPARERIRYFGDYELLEEIARGGMGVVYRARQITLNRTVAVKVLLFGKFSSDEFVKRFETEAQAAASLQHPNIVAIHEIGEHDGHHYFSMDYVPGKSLGELVRESPLPPKRAAAYLKIIAEAIHYAHQHGILHRDLKPSNVLIDEFDQPRITDFGLAKQLKGDSELTKPGHVMGSPSYMPPEQASPKRGTTGTYSDVYSLGAVLYHLLSGRPPFLAETVEDTLYQLSNNEPVGLRRLNTSIPRDLETICLKCLHKEPRRRYDSALALAEDLKRWLAGQTILARPSNSLERAWRWARREPRIASLSAAVLFVLVAAVIASVFSVFNSRRAERAERGLLRAAETTAFEKREQLVRLDVANGVRAMENGDSFGALLWFAEALRQEQPGSRAEEMHRYRIGAMLRYSPQLTQMWFHEGAINHGCFSPDGRWALTCGRDQTARLWDVVSGQPGPVLRHSSDVVEAAFCTNGSRVLTKCADGTVRVWDSASGQLDCPPLEHGYRISHALLSPDGRRVFTAGDPSETNLTASFFSSGTVKAGELRIWNAETGQQVRAPFRQNLRIHEMVLSPDGQWLAAAWGRSAIVWNLREPQALLLTGGKEPRSVHIPGLKSERNTADLEKLLAGIPPVRNSRVDESPWVGRMAFSPDNRRLLTQYGDGSVHIWPLSEGGQPLVLQMKMHGGLSAQELQERGPDFNTAAFSPDGRRVLLAENDGRVRLWDARTGEVEGQFQGKGCRRAWFSPDGRFVCLSSQIWDIEKGEAVSPAPLHPNLEWAAFSPNGASLLTAGTDGSVRLWSMAEPLITSFAHDSANAIAEPTAAEEPRAENSREQVERALLTNDPYVSHSAFSPDGLRVVTASWNGTARVWDAATGLAITPYVNLSAILDFAVFNPDGTRFAAVGGGAIDTPHHGLACVWDARTGRPVSPVIRHSQRLKSAEFSPNGRWLITHSDESAQAWDVRTGQPVELPVKFEGKIRSLAFGPDGQALAACALGPKMLYETRLWNVQTGQPMTPPLGVTNAVARMQFSPDGHWLVTFSEMGNELATSVRVWAVTGGQPVTPSLRLLLGQLPEATFTDSSRRVFLLPFCCEPVAWDLPGEQRLDSIRWRVWRMDTAAVTADGQRFVAQTGKDEVQVRDALTGEPLTPPLRLAGKALRWGIQFHHDGTFLLQGTGKRARLWSLPKEARPVADLVSLAQLLAGRRIDADGNLVSWPSSSASSEWARLSAKFPAGFARGSSQVRQWRERIVESSENGEHWFTAGFHLEQLIKENPADESLRMHRSRVRNQAAAAELR